MSDVNGDAKESMFIGTCACGRDLSIPNQVRVGSPVRCACRRAYYFEHDKDDPQTLNLICDSGVLVPALIVDLDGTIRKSKAGNRFIDGPDDVELYPGVIEKLAKYVELGYRIFGVTNQGGIAFGHKSELQVTDEVNATLELFGEDNPFCGVMVATSHPQGTVEPHCHRSFYRKPYYGALVEFERVARANGEVIDWDKSIVVGDRWDDRDMAKAAEVAFVWAWSFFDRDMPEDFEDE